MYNRKSSSPPQSTSSLQQFTSIGFALFALFGWMRLWGSLVNWHWLQYLQVWTGPFYLALTGLLWGLLGLVPLIYRSLRRPRAEWVDLGTAFVLALTYWIDRLAFRTAEARTNDLFAILITLLLLGIVMIQARPFHERKVKRTLTAAPPNHAEQIRVDSSKE